MEIGLIDVDGHNFPNFALMKISAWHKAKGDAVEWAQPVDLFTQKLTLWTLSLARVSSAVNILNNLEQYVPTPHDICKVSSFPQDYDFGKEKPQYICGMSVPPVMMAQVASRVYEQWLSHIPL